MPISYGLLGGLAEGVRGFQEGYERKQELNRRNRAEQAGLLQHGLELDENGQVVPGARFKQQQEYESQKYDPNSQASKDSRNLARTLLKSSNPSLNDQAVMQAIPETMHAGQLESSGLLGKGIQGGYGYQGQQARGQALQSMNEMRGKQFGLQQQKYAAHAGETFDKDKLMNQYTGTINNIERAQSMLDGNAPINSKAFNILQQDFINATAPGGAATEGKVNREMVQTIQGTLNDMQTKWGHVKDLRTEQPEIVNNLRQLFSQVKDDYSRAREDRARSIADNFSTAQDPNIQKVVNMKMSKYGSPKPGAPGMRVLSPEDKMAMDWASRNPMDPRAKQIKERLGM